MDSYSPSPRTSSRRHFLANAACTGLGAFLLAGCTFPVRSFRSTAAGAIEIPLTRFPELTKHGGMIKVRHSRFGEIFVRREGSDYIAVSAICTHQGCVVAPSASGFDCPCHGSTYDHHGHNTGGPAPRPLARFRAEGRAESVQIFLPRK